MVATLKCDTITNAANTGTANLSLDSSGNVTVGNGLTITGTQTFNGNLTLKTPSTTTALYEYWNNGTNNVAAIAGYSDSTTAGHLELYTTTGGTLTEQARIDQYGSLLVGTTTSPTTTAGLGTISAAGTVVMGSSFLRNRVINGDMRVNQRNTAVSASAYTVDRWQFAKSNDATESAAQSTDAPTGFSYSVKDTISVADTSIGAAQYAGFIQPIEGYNIADLSFGTANAKTVTVSFWVKATQTGTYSCLLQGGSPQRQVWKSYTVSASNTWEYKTLTFSGDTNTGSTWDTTSGIGLYLQFYYALGSSFQTGTDGVWAATSTNNFGPVGMANGLSANGNIFAITGVQLEVGSVATPFERRLYAQELNLCYRYFVKWVGTATGGAGFPPMGVGLATSSTNADLVLFTPVQMRSVPTLAITGACNLYDGTGNPAITSISTVYGSPENGSIWYIVQGASGGLTSGKGCFAYVGNASSNSFSMSAEF